MQRDLGFARKITNNIVKTKKNPITRVTATLAITTPTQPTYEEDMFN
jgi:hypothetical protein